MKDPHVRALIYKMKLRESVTFVDPPPVEHEEPGFLVHLARGELQIELLDHYADVLSARNAVAPFLDAWEIAAGLEAHRRDFWFLFERAEMIDRAPQLPDPPGVVGFGVSVLGRVNVGLQLTVAVHRSSYPLPPRAFRVTNEVRHLWDRYEATIDDREPPTSAGYYCYTMLKHGLVPQQTKGPDRIPWVASSLSIDETVLEKLNELTNKGDPLTARKHTGKPVAHTGEELNWLRMAVRVLTRRVGEWEHDRTAILPRITLSDLPSLSKSSK